MLRVCYALCLEQQARKPSTTRCVVAKTEAATYLVLGFGALCATGMFVVLRYV